ncbi:hypothetical protein [Mesorhizobium sp. M0045]|uniref:hypothetical protein n=1 Tax=Mesorhizobium sp. M0045 TaxID=2956857 RepID=UPI00333B0012
MPHALHSVTKSYAGTLAAALVHEGVLGDTKVLAHYLLWCTAGRSRTRRCAR